MDGLRFMTVCLRDGLLTGDGLLLIVCWLLSEVGLMGYACLSRVMSSFIKDRYI